MLDSGQPDQNHMSEVRERRRADFPSSSFAQMGYLAGRVATDALLGIEGDITKESVNEAFLQPQELRRATSGASRGTSTAAPVRTSPTTPTSPSPRRTGTMVQIEDCFEIAELADATRWPRSAPNES